MMSLKHLLLFVLLKVMHSIILLLCQISLQCVMCLPPYLPQNTLQLSHTLPPFTFLIVSSQPNLEASLLIIEQHIVVCCGVQNSTAQALHFQSCTPYHKARKGRRVRVEWEDEEIRKTTRSPWPPSKTNPHKDCRQNQWISGTAHVWVMLMWF